VCLTRGYTDPSRYDRLMDRNRSIYEVINRQRAQQYPLIIWHEGDISPEHQEYILAKELNADVQFVSVSDVFRLPDGLTEQDLVEYWSVGYRLMCRFHSYYIWQYARHFDYILRLDEDCTLTSAASDLFEWLAESEGDFATAAYLPEPHELTNQTLAPFARAFAANAPHGIGKGGPYNHQFPYTNFYVTRTAFWLQPDVQRFLHAAISKREFLRFRWGDAPVLGIALSQFAAPGKVLRISRIGYTHASHDWRFEPETHT
jgi:hypothetical protein